MAERPARKPELIAAHLAGRDVPCAACGYNLRGLSDVYCPECGAVIPRPPVEFAERARADPATLKLHCEECEYVVTGINADRCPECGSEGLKKFIGEAPAHHPRRLFTKLGVALPLIILGTAGILLGALCVSLATSGGALRAGRSINIWVGAGLSLGPPAIAIAWLYWRRAIARLERLERRTLAMVAGLASLGMLFASFRAL